MSVTMFPFGMHGWRAIPGVAQTEQREQSISSKPKKKVAFLFFLSQNTSAVSLTNLRLGTHLCKLRDTPVGRF